MGIDYPKLSILLLSAIQALKAEVTALQKNNQELQQQMDGLNDENEGLNIESEGLNIEGLSTANINNARIDNGTDEWVPWNLPSKIIYLWCESPDELNPYHNQYWASRIG